MRRFIPIAVTVVLILSASSALAQQPSVAEQIVNRYLATGTASERDLLLMMSQPKEFLRYQQALRASAPGLEQQALAIRRTVFQRALTRLTAGEGGGTAQAVIALGSWATELNAGDMDIVVRGGREAAKRLNQLLHEEIEKIFQQEGDDVCRAVFSKGARFTVETFEIFVSTLEDFGYDSLKTAFREALEIAAREGQAAGAAHLNRAADSIIRRNLNAQRFAAVQKEYYPGASGQDFVRDYFARQGKSRTWRVGDNGALDASWDAGLTADQLGETLLRDLGLSVDSMSGAFKFPVIADELVQWGERSKLGAREQAKGLVRAYEARPGGYFGLLTEEEKRVLEAARILAKTPRENQAYIRQALRSHGFATEQAFSKAGEEMLWNLTKASNNEAMRVLVENQKAAVEAAKAGKQVEAQYRRIRDYLMSNEQLAGYSKLKPEQLLKLADELPADMAFREEMAALLEFMAEGSETGARSAAAMAKRLVKLAYQQKRLSAEATEEAIKTIRAGKGVPADVEDVIAMLRKDLADLASIRAVSPATDSLADCIRTSSLFSKGGLNLTPELEAMIEEISKLSNIELLQLGFKNSEIALLQELNAARAQGARLTAIGEALKKTAPKNYRAILKGFVEEAKKAAPSSLAFQGAFALWGVYRVALDPSIPEEEQRKRLGEAIYTAFPTAGLVLDGLPMAYIQYTEGGEVDARGLGEGVAFAGLEILGLVHPVWAGALLAGYVTYQVSSFVLQAEEDRQFVMALYRAMDGNTLKVKDGTRSFDTSGVKVSVDPSKKLPVILHSAAFRDLYTSRGDVLLETGEGNKPYDRKVNAAIRDFAKRYVWDTNEDMKIWVQAVRKYFPDIDLDRVESWNLGELTEQAATVEKNEFKVGAHLVRRYINHRDLLTESVLRHIRGRLFEMQTALKTVEASKKELETVEKALDMEKKIVPNAQTEQDSFTGWLWDAATSNVTRLEQISGIWKRYLKTYREAVVVHGRVTKIFESADLSPPTGADLFSLTGVESTDKPKIDAVYQSFQTAFDKAYQEYRGAKGGNPDPKDPFDADAWKRLLSLRMRLFLGEFQKTTQARLAALEKDIGDVLEEVKEHYRDAVALTVTGPTEVEAMKDVTLKVAATKAGKPADDALKDARIEWTVDRTLKNSGATWWFSPLEETVMNITVTATKEISGKKVLLGSTTHRLSVKKPGDDKPGQAPATGSVKIIAPAAVKSTEIFAVRAELPPEIAGKAKSFRWETGYDTAYTATPESAVQYPLNASPKGEVRIRAHAGPLVDIWGGKAKDTSGEQLGEGKAGVAVTVLKFDAKASDIWEGGPYETGDGGVSFRRKSQTRKRTDGGKEVESAHASGGVTLEMKRDHKDVDCSAAWQMGGKPVPAGHTVRSMTIGPFKGDLIEKSFSSGYRGHYQFVDVAYPEAAVSGKGCVSHGKLAIQINYSGGASGTRLGQPPGIWYDDMPWVRGKVKEIHGEIQGILASVKLVPDGKRHAEPYKEKEIPVPIVKLRLSKEGKLKKGEVVDVTCVVENAPEDEKPLAYTWTGDHAGSGEKVQFLAAKGGKSMLSVSVAGRQGPIGAASAQFEVEDLKVKISGLKDRVVYGTEAVLSAQFDAPSDGSAPPPPADTGWKAPNEEEALKVFYATHNRLMKECEAKYRGTLPAKEFFSEKNRAAWMKLSECEDDARNQATKAKRCSLWPESEGCEGYKSTVSETPKAPTGYRVVWQSEPAITFDPATSDGSTTVLFDRMPAGGKIKIWAQLQKHSGGGSYATVGEAPQVETTVVPPVFKWAFEPGKGKGNVGKEVKVTITTVPEGIKPELLSYEWSYPESSNRMEYEKNASVIGFVPKSPKPVMLLVAPKVPFHRDLIGGSLKEEYQAGAYTVTVTGPSARGPKPQVWQEGKGLVEVDRAIAVFQQVALRAEVSPKPEKTPRWKWDVTPSGCTVSNDISQEITVSCSETGSFEVKATAKDPDGVELGSGSGSINVTISQQTLSESAKKAKEVQDRTKQTAEAKKKLQDAKTKARKGDYDGAIRDAEEAAKLDPANREAAATAQALRKERETIHHQIDKAKKLMDENRFADAQKELIVASNLNGYYPPVPAANQELGDRWRKYNDQVRDKVYEVRSANEKKDFGKALEIAAAWRASTKLDPYAEKELKQQEDWAKQWKARKDRQIEILKAAGGKVKSYDYAGALKQYDEGFANGQNIYNGTEPEYKEAVELRSQAFTKNKRLQELIPWVRKAAEDKEYLTVDALNNTLKTADEAIALQPTNEQLKKWREQIVARAEKTKADNERTAVGRKYLDAAGGAERGFLANENAIQSRQIQWNENVEVQQHRYLTAAIENYTASLQYIPDANVERKIKELEATLEGRKKVLAGVRQSKQIRAEADVLAQEARKDPDFSSSQAKFTQAAERYRQSLSLWRPPDVQILERVVFGLEVEKHDRAVKKHWADGQVLEKEAKYVTALAAYDRAIASFHPTVPQNDRMWAVVHAQDLRNRITGANNWRADGEAKQKAGKIAEAIASYRQSLKLLPDAALEEHVRMLEGRQAEAVQKKAAADRLWQEGTALFSQGRPSDALTKFKESQGYWSDATRTQYVADLEARRSRAVSLRERGAELQGQNRIQEAIIKYRESLSQWPDPALTAHIATLEGKLKQDADTAARKARAKQLRDEGYALQQRNQIQAAIGKYKESLAAWPDKQLEDHIRQLEAKIVSAPASPPASGTPSGSAAPLAGSWTANFNNYRGPFTIRSDGSATLDIGNGVETITDLRYDASSGRIAFTRMLKHVGPQHKQVYTGRLAREGYAEGTFDCTASGKGFPWKIERTATSSSTSSTQKPGGTPAETGSGRWAGAWKSDPGPDGEVVTFSLSQSGSRLTGSFQVDVPYTAASGARQKETLRGTIDGTVSGSRVTGTFREGSDKGATGTFEFTMAPGGNVFTAAVRGEDTSDTYTVRRGGSSSSSGPAVSSGQTAVRTVTAELTNRSRESTHIFTDGETFGPANRLAPGEKRKVTVTMKSDGSVTFKAGRNGQVMATKTWRGTPGESTRVPVVVFDDTNPYDKLTVTTGLR